MTNSEDLSSPDTLASMSSAKVSEVNGGGSPYGPPPNLNPRKKSLSVLAPDPDLTHSLPFHRICGEVPVAVFGTSEGVLALTNYRLFVQGRESASNVPLGQVEALEVRDIFFLHIHCKDARGLRVTFPNNETVSAALRRVQDALGPPKSIEDFFAFSFAKRVEEELAGEVREHLGLLRDPTTARERFYNEVKRMEFNVQNPWRVSDENEHYELCNSYPKLIIVPNSIDKKKLEQVACFRSARRFPAVVWRHRGNGAVICRCSQPEVGWFGWRSTEDEELVQNIIQACAYQSYDRLPNHGESQTVPLDSITAVASASNTSINGGGSIELVPEFPSNVKKLLILDARSYTTAVANRARGGGCECLEYYPNCEIQFMNLANIHSIRKSFINVRQLCALPSDQANWFSQLEGCKWLQHMSGLMKAAVTVVTAIENDGRPVMVHCSDGWDRTPQIVALAEILLDPYYRSLEGFQILVEREWLDFGHKFGDRCGQGVGSEDSNERCPVFLQWLDCLHQLLKQFPSAFEFNMAFLVKLVQHTYSNLFGTFLCNTAKEREQYNLPDKTMSVWKFLRSAPNQDKFHNSLYISCDKVLWPSCEVRDLVLWSQVYLGYENPRPLLTEAVNPSQESSPAPSVAELETSGRREPISRPLSTKARSSSYENLTQLHPHPSKGLQRKLSDSSLYGTQDHEPETCSVSKENLMSRSVLDDIESCSPLPSKHELYIQASDSGTALFSELEDSENEDTEPNSEARSESTVISAHKLNLKSIESSTDTLVAEMGTEGHQQKSEPVLSLPYPSNNNQLTNGSLAEDLLVEEIERSMMNHNTPPVLMEEKVGFVEDVGDLGYGMNGSGEHCAIISSCTVCESSQNLLKDMSGGCMGYSNSVPSRYGTKYNSYVTPAHSRHPSVAFNEDGSYSSLLGGRERSGLEASYSLAQTLDVDGLTHFHDEVQTRLGTIVSGYQATIDSLQRELHKVRMALSTQVSHRCTMFPCDRQDDAISVTGSLSSSEQHSVVSQSSETSSFEAVDERDTQPPLWVPDYAVTHCMGCNVCFGGFWLGKWLGKRKHHCRACGKVFCADCSENTVQLFHVTGVPSPDRVCRSCYNHHHRHLSGISEGVPNGADGPTSPSDQSPYTNARGSVSDPTLSSSVPYSTFLPTFPSSTACNHQKGKGGKPRKQLHETHHSCCTNGHGSHHHHVPKQRSPKPGSPPQN